MNLELGTGIGVEKSEKPGMLPEEGETISVVLEYGKVRIAFEFAADGVADEYSAGQGTSAMPILRAQGQALGVARCVGGGIRFATIVLRAIANCQRMPNPGVLAPKGRNKRTEYRPGKR